MTYDASIPLASDSPGLFPSQAQANFGRLQAIISANHQFNLSAAASDGYHNLIVMTQQAPTGPLAGVGRLYVKLIDGSVQLFYMDDLGNEQQISPEISIGPIKETGTALLNPGQQTLAFATPTYDYVAYATAYINGFPSQNSYVLVRTGGLASAFLFSPGGGISLAPTLFYTTNPPDPNFTDLMVKNNEAVPLNIVWSLMINRTT